MDNLISKRSATERLIIAKTLLESVLQDMPTAEPRRGKWIICSDGYYPYCSVCNYRPHEMTNYCPNCGARMEESE